ncbi:hypothetical protein P4631_10110 [Halalkalibacterium halodurans]|uniref:BH1959 protein n=1 Tax=Halalkalibacterium halodurans (strain ATCC BAA-125 / DSM 18197 / FERM 7344 / JCM 9153 / C-125) TaxID=272558 RepID=Q9KBG8_HALH5|nr:hypothetical protein [Halalkalibacterium halodurans]MED4172787.1 hypothetical protein [Halalkalibacterium halodurans]BAB05678.1 BH1959 [Halalkalibacterium halodurans C-125]
MNVYYQTSQAQVYWDPALKAVVLRWKGFAQGKQFKKINDKALELLKQKRGKKLLIDSREQSVIVQEDEAWLSKDWMPKAVEIGLKYSALVKPRNAIPKANLKKSCFKMGKLPYTGRCFIDMDEATKWLSSIDKTNVQECYTSI